MHTVPLLQNHGQPFEITELSVFQNGKTMAIRMVGRCSDVRQEYLFHNVSGLTVNDLCFPMVLQSFHILDHRPDGWDRSHSFELQDYEDHKIRFFCEYSEKNILPQSIY